MGPLNTCRRHFLLSIGPDFRLSTGAGLSMLADPTQPRKLVLPGRATAVVPFARNKLCIVSRQDLGATGQEVVEKLLDPTLRLATSTPIADPGGDDAWAAFAKAEALHPGAQRTLESKALQLIGSPNAMKPIAGKSPAASIFLADRADALIYYCSGSADLLRDVPGLGSRGLPGKLEVTAVHGLTLLSDKTAAQQLALFLLSEQGQAIFVKHGLLPVLAVE